MRAEDIFKSYYRQAVMAVEGVEAREFGAGWKKKIETRHLAFRDSSELRSYLVANAPFYLSHSIAYYRYPSARPMQKKEWVKADVVFDLDPPVKGKYDFVRYLERMKEDAQRLVEDFLIGDFGIERSYIEVVFSGSKGYHIYVKDPEYQLLGGEERRQLVEYVTGKGFKIEDHLFFEDKRLVGPKLGEGGYRGRVARLAKERAAALVGEEEKDFFVGGLAEGNWSRTSKNLKKVYQKVLSFKDALSVRSVASDVMVTQDLSRLIRVPESLHGDTGMIAKRVNDLERFDPFKDAILEADRTFKVRFVEDVDESLLGGPYYEGEVRELSLWKALLFVLKKSAIFL